MPLAKVGRIVQRDQQKRRCRTRHEANKCRHRNPAPQFEEKMKLFRERLAQLRFGQWASYKDVGVISSG